MRGIKFGFAAELGQNAAPGFGGASGGIGGNGGRDGPRNGPGFAPACTGGRTHRQPGRAGGQGDTFAGANGHAGARSGASPAGSTV